MTRQLSDAERYAAHVSRGNLYAFLISAWSAIDPAPYRDNWHIGCMCEYLQAVTDGEIRKLMINVPPGHQKSLTASVFWPAWTWIRQPEKRFLSTAYRGELALRDAERARELIRSSWYQARFGSAFAMSKSQDTKSRYSNNHGGYRFSAATSGIMGEGGDYVLLDDPHNVDQAESETVREDTVRRINLALPTRERSAKGGTVVIMQRLHERDYCGQQLADQGDKWTHLCLPARYSTVHPYIAKQHTLPSGRVLPGDPREDDGELLFPALFDEARVSTIEQAIGSYGAAGQLQQYPVPRTGGLFEREWFADAFIDEEALPPHRVRVRGWDLAGTTKKTSPYTAGVLVSRAGDGRIFVEHAQREKLSPGRVQAYVRSTAETDGRGVVCDIPQDPGQAGKAQVRAYARDMPGVRLKWSTESGSKITRAEPLSAQAEAGNIHIVRGEWNRWYIDELCAFPTGAFVDAVDATSRAYARLLQSGGTAGSAAVKGAS